MSKTPLVVAPRGRDVLGDPPLLVAVLFTIVAFGVLGTPAAAAVGIVPMGILFLGGPVLAFVGGVIALAGVGEAVSLAPLASHLVLSSFLVAATYTESGRRIGSIHLAAIAAYVGVFIMTQSALDSLAAQMAVLVGVLVFGGYAVHRYELLTLGLIDE